MYQKKLSYATLRKDELGTILQFPSASYRQEYSPRHIAHASHADSPATLDLIISLGRHGLKDKVHEDQLSAEGITSAQQTGAERLKDYDGTIIYKHSPKKRTRETAQNLNKGAGRKEFKAVQDDRLWPTKGEDDKVYNALYKRDGSEPALRKLISRDSEYGRFYDIIVKELYSYIRDQIRTYKRGKMRVETVSHSHFLDSLLADMLRKNGKDVEGPEDYGGAFKECDNFEVHAKRGKDGRLTITLHYRGQDVEIDPKTLGLSEQELKDAIAAMQEDGASEKSAEGSEQEEAEGSESAEGGSEAAEAA